MPFFQINQVSGVVETTQNLLGRLCWYTVHEKEVGINELKRQYELVKLPPEYLPKPIRSIDAFRRATSELEMVKIPYDDGSKKNLFINILVREVRTDNKIVVRQIVKEIVDSKNIKLSYQVVGEAVYERVSENIRCKAFATDDKHTKELLEKAKKLYTRYKEYYDGSHIRRMIRDIINKMNPTIVRPSGGVYFVPEEHAENLLKLRQLVQSLGNEFFTIPLINDAETRDMIYQKYIDQVTTQIIEIKKLMDDEKTSTAELKMLFDNSKEILQQIEKYENLLQTNLLDIKERANLLKTQLMQVLEQK